MVMPLCGTFSYAGVVPTEGVNSADWTLHDTSGASVECSGDNLFDNRLVGLHPTLTIAGGQFTLTASDRDRAQVSSASFQLDPAVIAVLQSGDILHLIRTGTGDRAVSVVRDHQLILAAGAVTVIELGAPISVSGKARPLRKPQDGDEWENIPTESWVDVALSGESLRLRSGEQAALGDYQISVLRTFQIGIPGDYECMAISLNGTCAHAPVVRSAELLISPDHGLVMTRWVTCSHHGHKRHSS